MRKRYPLTLIILGLSLALVAPVTAQVTATGEITIQTPSSPNLKQDK